MSQTFLTKSSCKCADLEPIALVGHDAVLKRGRRSTKEGGALLTNKIKSIKLFIFVLFSFVFGPSYGCSNIAISGNGQTVVARTLDLEENTGNIFALALPGGKNVSNLNLTTNKKIKPARWVTRYAFIGQSSMHSPNVLDGINSAGVYAGAFYLPEFTKYPNPNKNNSLPALGVMDSINYVLGTSENVKEALENLDAVCIVSSALAIYPENGKGIYSTYPLQMVIRDKSGDSALVAFIDGKKVVTHPAGPVVTNAPLLNWQIENAKKYNYTTSDNTNLKIAGVHMNGSGFYGMPGDWMPPGRFVRAYQVIKHLPAPKNTKEALNLANRVLESVITVPLGTNPSPTIWQTIADLNNNHYYFKVLYDIVDSESHGYKIVGNFNTAWEVYDLNRIAQTKQLPKGWLDATIKTNPRIKIKKLINQLNVPTPGKTGYRYYLAS